MMAQDREQRPDQDQRTAVDDYAARMIEATRRRASKRWQISRRNGCVMISRRKIESNLPVHSSVGKERQTR
jgi:hypothetical protein